MRTTKPSTIAALFHAAAAGKTRRQAAEELNIDYIWVCRLVSKHRIPFIHGHTVQRPKQSRQRALIGAVKAAGVLKDLSTQERLDTLTLMRIGGYDAPDAMRAIGRHDLVPKIEAITGVQL